MEKFSTWRDKATGVAPFIPVLRPKVLVPVLYSTAVFRTAMFVIRLPFLVLVLVLFAVVPVPVVRRVLAKALLVLCGIFRVTVVVDGVKRSQQRAARKHHPNDNDIVVVNFTLPIDALVLQSVTTNPVFLVPDGRGKLSQYSVAEVFVAALSPPAMDSKRPAVEWAQMAGKAVYVFAEGTPLNNKAVLPFPPMARLPVTHKLKRMVLLVAPPTLTTPVPMPVWRYVYRLASTITGAVLGRVVELDVDATWLGIRDLFELARMPLAGQQVGVAGKLAFLEAWGSQ